MQVTDISVDLDGAQSYPFIQVMPDGAHVEHEDELQVEHALNVYVNGILTMRLVCSPDHLVDLVLGRLFSEGMIAGVDDIAEISLCEYGTRALVYLKDRGADLSKKHVDTVASCCTFNRTLNSYFVTDDEVPQKVTPIAWDPAWIFNLAATFKADSPMHKRTFGAHSCYLASADQVLYHCEDLGRHNAFDKAIGAALRDGHDLGSLIAFTSGRVPTDMATKAVRSGIPIMVSKAVPTDLTVQMAQEFDLTLICSAYPDAMKVFNDPLHVIA